MKTAQEILEKHCSIVYNKYNGEEEIESSLSAVIIAMEDFSEQSHIEEDRKLLYNYTKWLSTQHFDVFSTRLVDAYLMNENIDYGK